MVSQEDKTRHNMLLKGVDWTTRTGMSAATLVIVTLTILIVGNAVIRSLSGSVIPGTYEFAQVAMPILVFLALPWTFQQRNNYELEFLYSRLKPRKQRVLDVLHLLLYVGVFVVWTVGAIGNSVHSLAIQEYVPGLVRVPVYPSRIAIALGCVLVLLVLIADLAQRARGRRQGRAARPTGGAI